MHTEGEPKPTVPDGPPKGRPREPGLQQPHGTALALHPKTHKGTKKKDGKKHDHAKDHGPIPPGHEGNNCAKSDMDKGCTCAGRFWRCADREDLTAKACDVGLECVRKNAFYAVRFLLFTGMPECICWDRRGQDRALRRPEVAVRNRVLYALRACVQGILFSLLWCGMEHDSCAWTVECGGVSSLGISMELYEHY